MHVFVCMYAVCVSWDKMKAEQASIYTLTELMTGQIKAPLNSKVVNNEFIRVT